MKAKNMTDCGILRTVFDKLNKAYAKFYNLLEHLAVDEVIVNSRAGLSSGSTFQRKENVPASKFINSVMNQGIHMTECTSLDSHFATDDMTNTRSC